MLEQVVLCTGLPLYFRGSYDAAGKSVHTVPSLAEGTMNEELGTRWKEALWLICSGVSGRFVAYLQRCVRALCGLSTAVCPDALWLICSGVS